MYLSQCFGIIFIEIFSTIIEFKQSAEVLAMLSVNAEAIEPVW